MKKGLIIIPAYNESANIENTVADIKKNAPDFDYVIINDCSKDNTLQILKGNGFNYVSLPVNLGIGGAVQTGYCYAYENGYETAVQVDGDGQHDVSYLNAMYDTMKEKNANMIIGSRFIEKEGFQSSALRRVGITYFTKMIKVLTGVTVTDPTSGFRLADRSVIEMFSKDYPRDYPEPESIVSVLRTGKSVTEYPVKMRARQGGESSITMGKSVYYMIKVSIACLIANMRNKA